jgi:FkbM family methyltransferase
VETVFPGLRGGYFVEAGATNGVNGSGTLVLERELGWSGICVEVIPDQFERLKKYRTCHADKRALWDESGKTIDFTIFPTRTGHSGISHLPRIRRFAQTAQVDAKRIEATTVTLMDLLRQHQAPPVIDYLCLDIEGAEPIVLGAFDFASPYTIRAISIEGHDCDQIMHAAGYRQVTNPFTNVTFETYWLHPSVPLRTR